MSAQPPLWIVPDADIDAIKIDGGFGDQPVFPSVGFTNQHFLGSELAYLRRSKLLCSGIDRLDLLANAQLRANGDDRWLWRYLGTAASEEALQDLRKNDRPPFDRDIYKILANVAAELMPLKAV